MWPGLYPPRWPAELPDATDKLTNRPADGTNDRIRANQRAEPIHVLAATRRSRAQARTRTARGYPQEGSYDNSPVPAAAPQPDRLGARMDRVADRRVGQPLGRLPDQAVTGALTSGSGSQDRRVSPSATITAGPGSKLAGALRTTGSLPPRTSTVHPPPSPSPRQPPDVAAAAPAAATAPVPQDSVS